MATIARNSAIDWKRAHGIVLARVFALDRIVAGGADLQPGGEGVDDQPEAREATAKAGVGIQKAEMQARRRIHLDAGVGGVAAIGSREVKFHGEIRETPC